MTRIAITLALAAAGGGAAHLAGLPLAFLLGPLVVVAAATLAGAPLARPPEWMTMPMRVVLGVAIGASFEPALLGDLAALGLTLLAVPVYVVVATAIGMVVYGRIGRYDRAEAFFAALPGGLYTMTAYAEDLGVDVRRIALAHALRVTAVVVAAPLLVWAFGGPSGRQALGGGEAWPGLAGAATLVASGIAGYWIGRLSRLPGGVILGPMVVSTGLHLSGVTTAVVPSELLGLAQVVLGAAIGARFLGESPRMIRDGVPLAVLSVALSGVVTVALAVPLALASGFDLVSLLLALAPGGMAEMSLVAVSLGLDAAFVATLHLLRILIVMLGAPVWWRRAARRRA